MHTKLTLTLDPTVIENAKAYSKSCGRSLSDLVESYLKAVADDSTGHVYRITPLVKSLQGSFRAPADFDYKKELSKALVKKYLK